MPLRQTRGVLASFKNLLTIPHYSTFARRAAGLVVPQISRGSGIGPLHLAADTMTGEILGKPTPRAVWMVWRLMGY
jgi:hypothetical protein